MFGSGPTNKKLNDILRIIKISNSGLSSMRKVIKVLEDHDILPKGITKAAQNEVNLKEVFFLPVLLGGLASSLLGSVLCKGLFWSGMCRSGEGILRAGEEILKKSINATTSFNKL